jgi:hypothetical protein
MARHINCAPSERPVFVANLKKAGGVALEHLCNKRQPRAIMLGLGPQQVPDHQQ